MSRGKGGKARDWSLLALAVIVLLGITLRALYLAEFAKGPEYTCPLVDADFHNYWARCLASGNWAPPEHEPDPKINEVPFFRPPGYPYFLAAVYKVAGSGYFWPRIVQLFIGMLNVLLAFFLARRYFGRVIGVVLAALMAVYWTFIYFETDFLEPVISVALTLGLVHVLLAWTRKLKLWMIFGAGLLLGLHALVRPNALVLFPVIGAWSLWIHARRGGLRRSWLSLVGLALGTALAVIPATVRNYVVAQDFVLISSNGGINLYIGNNDRADGLVRGTIPGIGTLDTSYDHLTIVAGVEKLLGRNLKHSEVSDYLANRAVQWMKRHPAKVLGLMWRKTLLFWGPVEPADNKVVEGDYAQSTVLRWIPINFAAAFALGLLGVVFFFRGALSRRKHKKDLSQSERARFEMAVLVVFLVLAWYASHLPFAVTCRYRVPVIPFLFLFGAIYIDGLVQFVRRREYQKTAFWGIALIPVLILTNINFAGYEPSMARWHYQQGIAYTRIGEMDKAVGFYRTAIELNPRYAAVYNDLGAALASQGKIAESIPYFRLAVQGRPNSAVAHLNLALALEQVGDYDQAYAHYTRVLQLDPQLQDARAGLERVRRVLDQQRTPQSR